MTFRQLLGLRVQLTPIPHIEIAPAQKIVLHGVGNGGKPLCGFVDKLPAFWPAGHKYVNPQFQIDEITCPGCKAEAIKRFS